jgi:hypothetical protein
MAGLHAAQALLGHASIQTTEGYLTMPSPDELAEAMAKVSLWGDGCSSPIAPASSPPGSSTTRSRTGADGRACLIPRGGRRA